MVHNYKKEKSCPFCGEMTKNFFETEDSTLVCKNCYEEESDNSYYDSEEEGY
jgi:formylmethanofuran dehydrogenase subunit E